MTIRSDEYIYLLLNHLQVERDYLEYLETSRPMFFLKEKCKEHDGKIARQKEYIEELKNKLYEEKEYNKISTQKMNSRV